MARPVRTREGRLPVLAEPVGAHSLPGVELHYTSAFDLVLQWF